MYGEINTATAPPPPAPRVMPMEMRQNLQTADAHRREHDISSTLCAEDCGQRIRAGLGVAWRLTSEPSSAPAHAPPAKIDYRPLQRAPLAQPSAPKTLVVWVVCCSILTLFSRGSCAQRVR